MYSTRYHFQVQFFCSDVVKKKMEAKEIFVMKMMPSLKKDSAKRIIIITVFWARTFASFFLWRWMWIENVLFGEKTFAHHWETIKIKSSEANRYRHTVVKIQWCSISSTIEFFRACFRHFEKFYTCDIFCTWKRTHSKLKREKISKFWWKIHWNWTSKLFFYEFSAMLWTTSPFQNFDGRANVFSGVLYCYN